MNKNIWILGGLALVIILVLNANPRFVTHCYPDAGCDSDECEEPNAVLMCEI